MIAEDAATPLGAAWFRLWTTELHSYGFVDASTPELVIAVSLQHRRNGIGRTLLRDLISMARADRFPALSLSVSPFNPVRGCTSRWVFTRSANQARHGPFDCRSNTTSRLQPDRRSDRPRSDDDRPDSRRHLANHHIEGVDGDQDQHGAMQPDSRSQAPPATCAVCESRVWRISRVGRYL